jgi:hypothetical protein
MCVRAHEITQVLLTLGPHKCQQILAGISLVNKAFAAGSQHMMAAFARLNELQDSTEDVLGRLGENFKMLAKGDLALQMQQGVAVLMAVHLSQVRE